jgi:hypothetical protein
VTLGLRVPSRACRDVSASAVYGLFIRYMDREVAARDEPVSRRAASFVSKS